MFNEAANKEYISVQFQIQAEIEKLQDVLAKHNQQAANINWEHVGDMNYILSQLKQLNEEEEKDD